jgi:hypothetical protein
MSEPTLTRREAVLATAATLAALLGCKRTTESGWTPIDPRRGGVFIHAVDDDAPVLDPAQTCGAAVTLRSERVRSVETPVRFLVAEDASDAGRQQLEDCLAKQFVPVGRGFGVCRNQSAPAWRSFLIDVEPALSPTHCKAVMVAPGSDGGPPGGVSVQFTEDGGERLAALTGSRVGQRIAIVVGSLIAAAPVVMTEITGGMAILSLGPDPDEKYARALANTISGDYPGEVRRGVRTFGRSKA